jgi:hypothetical protein
MAESTPEELVSKALESLSSEERQRATTWLLGRSSAGSGQRGGWLGRQVTAADPLSGMTTSQSFLELWSRGLLGSTPSAEKAAQLVPVPVRLPGDLHARLREWSTEHGFSMATVMRGLVARFLEGQESGEAAPEM